MKRILLTSAICLGVMASAATAATLKVEIWDVIATQGLNNNPAPADQEGLRAIGGGSDGNYFTDQATDSPTETSVLAAIASRSADAIFSIDTAGLAAGFGPVNFNSNPATIQEFFSNALSDFTLIADNGVGTDASVLDNSILGTVARITGLVDVDAASDLTITSDDGWQLTVGGASPVLNTGLNGVDGGLQGPGSSDTVALAAGQNQSFELIWFEGNVNDAQLKLTVGDDVTLKPVPLPASALLLLGSVAGLGVMRRRRKS